MSDLAIRKNEVLKMVGQAFLAKKTKCPDGYDKDLAIELAVPVLMNLQDKNKQPALTTCDPKSIANALYLMCVKGYYIHLSHCAFIVYGNSVTLQDQYQGKVMRARRDWGLKEIICDVVYKGDTLEIKRDEVGHKIYTHISAPFAERKTDLSEIVGVWCYLVWSDGTRTAHEMTIDQVRKAWGMNRFGAGKTHENFSEKMVRKTCFSSALTEWGNTNPNIAIDTDFDSEITFDTKYEDLSNQMQITAETLNSLPASEAEPINLPNEAPKAERTSRNH